MSSTCVLMMGTRIPEIREYGAEWDARTVYGQYAATDAQLGLCWVY